MSKKKTNEEFQTELREKNKNVYTDDVYIGAKTKMDFYCDKGHHWFSTPDTILNKKRGCPYCAGQRPIVGETDLWTTRPDIAKLLKNSEDGYIYMEGSHKKVCFVCPNCGTEHENIVSTVSYYGLSCPACSDGISYPNKFMSNVLRQLNVEFIPEYSPKWIRPYRYDFFFVKENSQYIVELDGGLGHGHLNTGYKIKSPDDAIKIDLYKDKMALEHNIKVIRIDCNYTSKDRFEYVKQHILESELSNVFNIFDIDFIKCDIDSQKSLFIETCKLWDSGIHDKYKIAKILGVSHDTIRNYLIKSEKLGCSTYKHAEYYKNAVINSRKKSAFTQGNPVMCIETGDIFRSITSVKKTVGFSVQYAINDQNKTAGALEDGTKLHWRNLTTEELELYKTDNNFDSQKINFTYFKQSDVL